MRIIKVIYDDNSSFIVDIVNKFKQGNIIELYNTSFFKTIKKARPIQTRFGSHNVPLVVFENENLEEIGAIWAESSPDWEEAIKKELEKDVSIR